MQMLSVRSEQATTVFVCVFKRTPSKDRLLNDWTGSFVIPAFLETIVYNITYHISSLVDHISRGLLKYDVAYCE